MAIQTDEDDDNQSRPRVPVFLVVLLVSALLWIGGICLAIEFLE